MRRTPCSWPAWRSSSRCGTWTDNARGSSSWTATPSSRSSFKMRSRFAARARPPCGRTARTSSRPISSSSRGRGSPELLPGVGSRSSADPSVIERENDERLGKRISSPWAMRSPEGKELSTRTIGLAVLAMALVTAAFAVTVARADDGAGTQWNAVLAGINERPTPRDTQARGVAIFELSADGESMHYKVIAANINNVIMAHIHLGDANTAGPVIVWLYPIGGPPPAAPGGGRLYRIPAPGGFRPTKIAGPRAGDPASRPTKRGASRRRIWPPAAISRTALRVIPGSAPSYVAGVRRAPPETRNTFRAVVSTTRPRSFRRSASNAPSASASRKATDSATREIDLIWLSGPDNRRTVAATCSAGRGGISGSARDVIVAMPRVVDRSPAMIVIRKRPSTTPLLSTTFRAPWRRSSTLQGGSMRSTSRPTRSRSKWASIRKGAPPWIRTVSKHPSPYRKPRFCGEMRASSSGIKAPSSHTEAVRRHLHAVVREGLGVSAELVERFAVLRLRVRVGDDPAADREIGCLADDRRGADRDVPVDRAIPGDVADRARVDAAPMRLEPPDELHGPPLW